MIFISQGRFTREAMAGMAAKPEDRSAEVRKLMRKAGGKLLGSYFTFGEYDFAVITEFDDINSVTPALIVSAAGGSVTGITTSVGMRWDEAQEAFGKAGKLAKSFRQAGAKK